MRLTWWLLKATTWNTASSRGILLPRTWQTWLVFQGNLRLRQVWFSFSNIYHKYIRVYIYIYIHTMIHICLESMSMCRQWVVGISDCQWIPWNSKKMCVFLYTLPEINSSHLKIGHPKRKRESIPSIHFQVQAVSFREGIPKGSLRMSPTKMSQESSM